MAFYAGPTEPVCAADVAIGDRLVDDRPEAGYLTVTDVRKADTVRLWFDNGDGVTYQHHQKLRRVREGQVA